MKPSKRLERIPPYAFAELERKIAAKRAAGVDVISLGIGDPDRPTPALIVEAMQEAVSEPEPREWRPDEPPLSGMGRRRGRAGRCRVQRELLRQLAHVRLDGEACAGK